MCAQVHAVSAPRRFPWLKDCLGDRLDVNRFFAIELKMEKI